jgi:MarR-like DNA-binding transcriptional regulator SgrR of sgrS sRNA
MRWWPAIIVCLIGAGANAYLPPPYGGTVTAPLPDMPVTLDPARATRESELQVIHLLFDTLYKDSGRGLPRPHLIQSAPDISADGKTWRLHLRSGIVMHNGQILRAGHVVASLQRLRRAGSNAYLLSPVLSVSAENDSVVVIQLHRQAPGLLPWLLSTPATAIAIRHNKLWIGTGPFRLSSKTASGLVLEAHREHFTGRPYLDGVHLRVFTKASDQVVAFQVGKLQVSLHGTTVFGGQPRPPFTTVESPKAATVFAGIGHKTPLLEDRLFRRALMRGIDRRRLGRLASTGAFAVANSPVAQPLKGVRPKPIAFNRGQARGLLKRALSRHSIKLPRLSLLVDASRAEDPIVAGLLVADLDRLGIATTIVSLPAAKYQTRLRKGQFDLVLLRLPLQVPHSVVALASVLAAAGDAKEAARCLSATSCGAKEARSFMKRLPLLPLVHASTRIAVDARLGALPILPSGRLGYADVYYQRGIP